MQYKNRPKPLIDAIRAKKETHIKCGPDSVTANVGDWMLFEDGVFLGVMCDEAFKKDYEPVVQNSFTTHTRVDPWYVAKPFQDSPTVTPLFFKGRNY
jgi:hypothetical protein